MASGHTIVGLLIAKSWPGCQSRAVTSHAGRGSASALWNAENAIFRALEHWFAMALSSRSGLGWKGRATAGRQTEIAVHLNEYGC